MSDDSKPMLPTPALVAGYARVLQRYDLTQIEIVSSELSLVLRRDHPQVSISPQSAQMPVPPSPPPYPPTQYPTGSAQHAGDAGAQANLLGVSVETNESVRGDVDEHILRAQMLGTAYLSRSPGTPPFVAIGDSVKTGDVVMIIEAMKVMNQVIAHRDGIVRKILVNDGDPVEFDQPLLVIT